MINTNVGMGRSLLIQLRVCLIWIVLFSPIIEIDGVVLASKC